MDYSDEKVKAFQELYKAEMGRDIPDVHARTVMFQLTELMEVLMRPLPLPPPRDQED